MPEIIILLSFSVVGITLLCISGLLIIRKAMKEGIPFDYLERPFSLGIIGMMLVLIYMILSWHPNF